MLRRNHRPIRMPRLSTVISYHLLERNNLSWFVWWYVDKNSRNLSNTNRTPNYRFLYFISFFRFVLSFSALLLLYVCLFLYFNVVQNKAACNILQSKTLTTNPIKNYLNKAFLKSYRNLKLFCQIKKFKRLYISQPIREYLICKC